MALKCSRSRTSTRCTFRLCAYAKCLFIAFLWVLSVKCIASSESPSVTEELPTKSESLIQSLWQTLKQNLEMPSAALSAKPTSAKAHIMNRGNQYPQLNHKESTSRRFFLMKKSVQEHYLKKDPIESSFDESDARALRWSREQEGRDCAFFQSAGTFWSFQWCPQSTIFQGRRNKDMTVDLKIKIGSFVDLKSDSISGVLSSLYTQLSTLFPQSQIELYNEGNFCKEVGSKRVAAVVMHDDSSPFCAFLVQSTQGQAFAISRVEEPQPCAYVLHVCKLPFMGTRPNPTSDLIDSASGMSTLNQTMEDSHRLVAAYLRQTNSELLRTSSPDRTSSLHTGLPPLPPSRIESNLNLIKEMFGHAYDSYMYNAYPASEVKPLSCKAAVFDPVRIPALTLIDSLDTLIILGNYTEFARSVERLRVLHNQMAEEHKYLGKGGLFRLNQNVSVFETNIRVLGGLLGAHQLAEAAMSNAVLESEVWDANGAVLIGDSSKLICGRDENMDEEKDSEDFSSSILQCRIADSAEARSRNQTLRHWKYDGFLLELAQDIGERLLPAFSTRTGIPYGTVNLMNGIPKDETTIASLAGGGTLSLEMELLSRLTGNPEFGRAAKLSARALWMRRSRFNTYGKHICTRRGDWTESLSGIGSNSDSFYEYLLKHYILFPEDQDFWYSLLSSYGGVHNESRLGDWYADVDLNRGLSTNGLARQVFEALMAFYPGMQTLLGELTPAAHSLNSFFLVREFLGFLPERFDFGSWKVDGGGGTHFLRPELLESAYFLHRATKGLHRQLNVDANDTAAGYSGWQWAADYSLHTLNTLTRSKCGYASVRDLHPSITGAAGLGAPRKAKLLDDMPSFFLSETLKYLYLTFDDGNIVHADEDHEWVFTTEAHPIHHENLAVKRDRKSRLQSQKEDLIKRLRSRLENDDSATRSTWDGLDAEKWSIDSRLHTFLEQMNSVVSQSSMASTDRSISFKSTVTEPILSKEHVHNDLDVFGETQNGLNDAHLMFRRTGNGVSLTKSCPNFYSSELLYVRALNGGGIDYSNAYASSMKDVVGLDESRFILTGSIDALAWQGSGVHISRAHNPTRECPLSNQDRMKQKTESPKPQAEEQSIVKRFDGGEMGHFEISAFSGGVGFFIRHVETGRSFTTTLIQDEASLSMETYLMVHSTMDKKNVGGGNSEPHGDLEDRDTVVMADLAGNSHVCQVEILQTREHSSSHDDNRLGNDGMDTRVLARYPCAPAMFGPAHISNLNHAGDVVVEAPIFPPPLGDEKGCISNTGHFLDPFHDLSQCESKRVEGACMQKVAQLVKRGGCTFQEKSLNQIGADAVIVINSADNEVFVMSGNGDESLEDPDVVQTYPLTVLVKGSDGKSILDVIEANRGDKARLLSRVSLFKEKPQIREDGGIFSVIHNQFWPVVVASPDGIRIFVEGGWGVQAVQTSQMVGAKDFEWQLYLMKHSDSGTRRTMETAAETS